MEEQPQLDLGLVCEASTMTPGKTPMTQTDTRVTAGMIVIGDEILSGRTKDVNIGAVADFCTDLGIDLTEVRVVSDEMDHIVEAVNALRARYTYVFTTGGIGPTHDDITADAIATAFGVALPINAQARAMLGWSIEELSRESGVSVEAIQRFENEQTVLDVTRLALAYRLESEGLAFFPGFAPGRGMNVRGSTPNPVGRADYAMVE